MARSSSRRRRTTLASVISNPRKRSKAPRVIANPKRRRKVSRKSRRASSRKSFRRNPRTGRFMRKAARHNPKRRSRSRKSYRRNPAYKLSSTAKRGWKKVRSNGRRRGFKAYRNPGRIASMFRRLPIVGGPLAAAFGGLPAGVVAGMTVELPLRAAPWFADKSWVPDFVKTNEFAYFTILGALTGGVLAGASRAVGLKIPFLQPGQVAALCTAAGAGAGWAKMRTRQMANEAGIATPEQQAAGDDAVAGLGALVSYSGGGMGLLTSDMGMGPAYSVAPGGMGRMGAVIVGS